MNFLQLCQRLRQEVGAAGDSTLPASVNGQLGEYARLVAWIRQAWIDIQSEHDSWGFMSSTDHVIKAKQDINSVWSFTLPSDLERLDNNSVSIAAPDGTHIGFLKFVDWDDFRRMYRGRVEQGRPQVFTITPDKQLKTFPVVDNSYRLTFDYQKAPQALESNTDVPSIPEAYHMLIVYRAMLYYAGYEMAVEVKDRAITESEPLMSKLERRYLPTPNIGSALA